jgi:uridine kinase
LVETYFIPIYNIHFSKDSFYRNLANADETAKALRGDFNFDHPDAFEHTLMLATLKEMRAGKRVEIPKYDFKTQSRFEFKIYSKNKLIFKGWFPTN